MIKSNKANKKTAKIPLIKEISLRHPLKQLNGPIRVQRMMRRIRKKMTKKAKAQKKIYKKKG